MRDLAEYIKVQVLADATISAIIGTKFFPDFVPENTGYPVLTYSVSNVAEELTKDTSGTYRELDVIFDAYSDDKLETFSIVDAIYDLFHRLVQTTYNSIIINGVYVVDGGSAVVGESNIYRQYIEFRFRVNK